MSTRVHPALTGIHQCVSAPGRGHPLSHGQLTAIEQAARHKSCTIINKWQPRHRRRNVLGCRSPLSATDCGLKHVEPCTEQKHIQCRSCPPGSSPQRAPPLTSEVGMGVHVHVKQVLPGQNVDTTCCTRPAGAPV